jgi:hypothetical protein
MKAAPQTSESIDWHHFRAKPQAWHDANDADHKQKQSLAPLFHLRFNSFLLALTDRNNTIQRNAAQRNAAQRKRSQRKAAKPRITSNYEYTSSVPLPPLSPNHHNLISEEAGQSRTL